MILSILIPTVPQRAKGFFDLHMNAIKQIYDCQRFSDVEVIYDFSPVGDKTTGEKRNNLLTKASGKYVWFIDDDDEISDTAITDILEAVKSDPDALAINGTMTTNGADEKRWFISKDLEYKADWIDGKEVYLRPTNHITPIKRDIALQVPFELKSNFEDYAYCMKLKELGLVKTEVKIEKPIYHYRYQNYDKLY